jgi:hypothetical protein
VRDVPPHARTKARNAYFREGPERLDPDGDVDAAIPRRLRPPRIADLVKHLGDDAGDRLRVGEIRARLRVDVDPQLVGMLDVAPAGGPWMEVDRAEVRRPGDVRDFGHAELVRVTA